MAVTIKLNGQALSVEVSIEVYEYLDWADHKTENLAHEQRRHRGRRIYPRRRKSLRQRLRYADSGVRRFLDALMDMAE